MRIISTVIFYFLVLMTGFPKSALSVNFYGQNIQIQPAQPKRPSHLLPIVSDYYSAASNPETLSRNADLVPSLSDPEEEVMKIANNEFIKLMDRMMTKYLLENPKQKLQGNTLNVNDIRKKSVAHLQQMLAPKFSGRGSYGYGRPDDDCIEVICPPKSPRGPVGPRGNPGPKGDEGQGGVLGLKGYTGTRGPKGIMRSKGEMGREGRKGMKGLRHKGIPSTIKGHDGSPAPKGNTGASIKGFKGANTVKGFKGHKGRCAFYL